MPLCPMSDPPADERNGDNHVDGRNRREYKMNVNLFSVVPLFSCLSSLPTGWKTQTASTTRFFVAFLPRSLLDVIVLGNQSFRGPPLSDSIKFHKRG